ncbi:MAG: DUF3878 family protein, partial [Eubacterium sp.]|nr:DUF3878 family protein [Eubacterium sp.]
MIKTLTPQQASARLHALESTGSIPVYQMLPEEAIHVPGHGPRYLIPYLMSDVIEDYLILCGLPEGCVLAEDVTAEELLSLPQVTFMESITLYRFDRIGHLWVEDHPVIRRLVNFSLCLRNIYRFIDPEDSGELLPFLPQLVEFAPFRYWSPIRESIDDWAEETPAGLTAFRHYAEKAEDQVL